MPTKSTHSSIEIEELEGRAGELIDERRRIARRRLPGEDVVRVEAGPEAESFRRTASDCEMITEAPSLGLGPANVTGGFDSQSRQTVPTPGDDVVQIRDCGLTVDGLGGNDDLVGHECDDIALGADGNDLLEGDIGNDTLHGGEGNDRISGRRGAGVIDGGGGDDLITGDRGPDEIEGGPGSDNINAGLDRDTVSGGAGDDTIISRDGERDIVNCGLGRDEVLSDRLDVLRQCEALARD